MLCILYILRYILYVFYVFYIFYVIHVIYVHMKFSQPTYLQQNSHSLRTIHISSIKEYLTYLQSLHLIYGILLSPPCFLLSRQGARDSWVGRGHNVWTRPSESSHSKYHYSLPLHNKSLDWCSTCQWPICNPLGSPAPCVWSVFDIFLRLMTECAARSRKTWSQIVHHVSMLQKPNWHQDNTEQLWGPDQEWFIKNLRNMVK